MVNHDPRHTNNTAQPHSYSRERHVAAEADWAEANVIINKISWGAVFAGVVLALSAHLLLNLLGIGIGASTIDPAGPGDGAPSVSTFAWGTAIWWIIAGIVAAFFGGFVASRLSGKPSRSTGSWHGLTSWALTTLTLFYLLSTAVGALAGGAYSIVADTAGTMASATQNLAQATGSAVQYASNNLNAIESAAGDIIDQQTWNQFEQRISNEVDQMSGGLEMSEVRNAVMNVMNAMASQNQSALQQARQEAVMIISEVQQIPRSQARQELNNYEQEMTQLYNSLTQQASQAVDTVQREATQAVDIVATDISQAAWASFIALLLGAIAAWFGGAAGTRKTA